MNDTEKQKILEELGGISNEVYDKLLLAFVEQTKRQLKYLKGSIEKRDKIKSAEIAHCIKGACANLRLAEFLEIICKIEKEIQNDDLIHCEKNIEVFNKKLNDLGI